MGSSPINGFSLTGKLLSAKDPVFSAYALPKGRQQSHVRVQRADFLTAATRLGSVAAAAKELGNNRSTCQKWANVAGIRPQRSYTQAEPGQFYAVLNRAGTTTEAASLLGLNNSTAQNWAHSANRANSQPTNPGPRYRRSHTQCLGGLGQNHVQRRFFLPTCSSRLPKSCVESRQSSVVRSGCRLSSVHGDGSSRGESAELSDRI